MARARYRQRKPGGGPGGGGIGSGEPILELLAAGDYYTAGENANGPYVARGWIATTKFNDVGAGDTTTYEDGVTQISHLKVFVSTSIATWAQTFFYNTAAASSYYYWTGSAWSPLQDNALEWDVHGSYTSSSRTATLSGGAAAIAVRCVLTATAGTARLSDSRPAA